MVASCIHKVVTGSYRYTTLKDATWAIWSIMKIQRALKAMEREEGARLREEGLVFEEVFQGSAEIGVYFAIALSLAAVSLGVFALFKYNSQAKMPWGWPGPAI